MCDVFLSFITFSLGVLGQVWYLIVSTPDPAFFLTLVEGIIRNISVLIFQFHWNYFEFSYFGTQVLLRMHIYDPVCAV